MERAFYDIPALVEDPSVDLRQPGDSERVLPRKLFSMAM